MKRSACWHEAIIKLKKLLCTSVISLNWVVSISQLIVNTLEKILCFLIKEGLIVLVSYWDLANLWENLWLVAGERVRGISKNQFLVKSNLTFL